MAETQTTEAETTEASLSDALGAAWDAADARDVNQEARINSTSEAAGQEAEATEDGAETAAEDTDSETTDVEDVQADTDEPDPDEGEGETDSVEPPHHWSQADKDAFNALPEELKPLWLDKSKSLEAGFDKKFQELGKSRETAEFLEKTFEPIQQELAVAGLDQRTAVARFVAWHQALRTNPNEAIKGLAQMYGADLQAGEAQADEEYLDPTAAREITALKAEIQELKQHNRQSTENTRAQEAQAVSSAIQTFKEAVNDDGQPAHPHYEQVERAMIGIISTIDPSLPPQERLRQAYEQAVWANPNVRASLLERQTKEQAAAQEKARKAEVEKARKAGKRNIKPNAGGQEKPKTLKEELAQQMDAAASA